MTSAHQAKNGMESMPPIHDRRSEQFEKSAHGRAVKLGKKCYQDAILKWIDMLIANNLTENYYVQALKNFLSCEARENELVMQNITDRFDSKRGVKKAIQRRKPWFTGPLEDKDQTSTLVARKVDFSNRLTVVNQLAADYAKEPVVEKEIEKQKKSDAGNKEFYKNMFSSSQTVNDK